MKINYKNENDTILVKLSGELDTPAADEIQPVVDELLGLCDHDIIIDCAELTYIASAGLRQLLSLRKATRANGKKLQLDNIIPAVMEVFRVTNFYRLFGLC